MQGYVIGLDIGTGSAKAVAVDAENKVLAVSQNFYDTNRPQPGYSEQDPEIIWLAFVNCIKEVLIKIKQLPVAVSFSSGMHSLLIMDNNNTAITPLLTWADTRSENIAAALRQSAEGEKIYKVTGTPIHSMSPLCKIKWMKENTPDIFARAFKFISIKEFIWFRLFNVYQVDYSIASATGLFNIETFKWNADSLQFCGININQLSEPVSTSFIRSDVNTAIAGDLNINAQTNFCIGASDGCLANLGSNAIEAGKAALTIGTSGAVRIAGPAPIINYEAMIFNYPLDDKTFISGGPINNGGNILHWLFKTFFNNANPSENDYNDFFKNVDTINSGSDGLLFLPYLFGERAPIWDEESSGVYFGIKPLHNRSHFFRAAIEGICFVLKSILDTIEASTVSIKQLNVSGGFVHSKTWMQILADVTNKKICLVQTEDASSVGAALLGMKALKFINDYSILNEEEGTIINANEKNAATYQQYYKVFKNLYKPMEQSMHQLHEIKI